MPLLSNPILPIGAVVIVSVILIYKEIEKHNANEASAASAQSEADAGVLAAMGQGTELTNIPAGGELPSNYIEAGEVSTEPSNTAMNESYAEPVALNIVSTT